MTSKSPSELFWSKVNILGPDKCWEWMASKFKDGHGQFSSGKRFGLSVQAHRTAYILIHSSIPEGQSILHHCDNKSCCNPRHLYAGTQQDNMDDFWERGKRNTARQCGSSNGGSKLTESQIMAIRNDQRVLRLISQEYDVSKSHISKIKRGQRWSIPFKV